MAGGKRRNGTTKALLATAVAVASLALVPAASAAAEPSFEAAGSMFESRTRAAAVTLDDGSVLIAGGCRYSSPKQHEGCTVRSAETYDPTTGAFGPTGSMATGRVDAAAAPLPNGSALIAGGVNTEGPAYASAEIYDPSTGKFTATGSMATTRWGAAAASLPDGRVLVAGGVGGEKSAEIFNPATGAFSPTGSMSVGRRFFAAATLPDGRVLLAGGAGIEASAEIFDPATETFSSAGTMPYGGMTRAAPLADGTVVIFSDEPEYTGAEWHHERKLESYDPATGSFSVLSLPSPSRSYMAVAPLGGGRLLVAGGSSDEAAAFLGHDVVPTAEIFISDPSSTAPASIGGGTGEGGSPGNSPASGRIESSSQEAGWEAATASSDGRAAARSPRVVAVPKAKRSCREAKAGKRHASSRSRCVRQGSKHQRYPGTHVS